MDAWNVEGINSSDSDERSNPNDAEYIPSTEKKRIPSLRGIMAYRASTRQRGSLIRTGESNTVVGIMSRGRVSGRRCRSRSRGVSRGSASRTEMLESHRQFVEYIAEDDFMDLSIAPNSEPNIPKLTKGI